MSSSLLSHADFRKPEKEKRKDGGQDHGSKVRDVVPPVRMKPFEQQRISHHGYRAERHGKAGELRAQDKTKTHEYARGNGYADDIVEKRKEKILLDFPHGRAAQADGGDHVPEVILDDHDSP